MHKVGDYLVYRKDVCLVSDILINYYNNTDYYLLLPLGDESLSVKVPVNNKFISSLISKEEANKIIKKIPSIPIIEAENDKIMEQEYKNIFAEENPEGLIRIIKTTYTRNKKRLDEKKKISEKDNNSFLAAEKFLYNELAIVLGLNPEEVKDYINSKIGI